MTTPFSAYFIAWGTPKAQPRTRAVVRHRGPKVFAGVYDDGTADGWKSIVRAESRAHRPDAPMGMACVSLAFWFKRPKGHYRTGKFSQQLRADAPTTYHAQKPDADNLAKAVLDVLTEEGWWHDDGAVATLFVEKRWSEHGQPPHCGIQVSDMRC